jgi:alanyl-tRNA synthetase
MGDTGPCGPCSEIHFDRIGGRDAAALVNQDDPNVLEIWNIVFVQYNRDSPTKLSTLPKQHIDTGMGLERLASILQGKTSNYDIDVFQPLFEKIQETSQLGQPYGGLLGDDDVDLRDTAYRATADHARALCFALADGAVPNNEGRGYVLRRILRRAARYGQQILKCEPGFFAQLVPVVVETFGDAYPELRAKQSDIQEIITEEEEAFSTMLDRGIKYFGELEETLEEKDSNTVSGKEAFFMYDTLGFPLDLTELMAEEAGLTLDSDGFRKEMETQKQRSREARYASKDGSGNDIPRMELIAEQTAWLSDQKIDPTDDSTKYEWDVKTSAKIQAIYTLAGDFLTGDDASVSEGDVVGIILDKSSFYAEAGGQVADTGKLMVMDGDGSVTLEVDVTDVQTYAGFLLHTGVIKAGSLQVRDKDTSIQCQVDYARRRDIAPNHTMTHVLNSALRQVLGDKVDVEQRGSLCNDEKLRFDFTCKKALTLTQLKQVEDYVSEVIQSSLEVSNQVMPLDEAKAIDGVRAVFGEIYPDPVRVVSVGSETNVSVEFCGGTHLSNTAEAQAFCLVEETAVAKGIRRITAATKGEAQRAIKAGGEMETKVVTLEKSSSSDEDDMELDSKAGALRKELDEAFVSAPLKAELRGRLEVLQKQGALQKKQQLQKRVDRCLVDVRAQVQAALDEGKNVVVLNTDIGADAKASQRVLKEVQKMAKSADGGLAFMGLSEEEPGSGGKVLCYTWISDELVETNSGFKADEWVRTALASVGGRGGGKPTNAQGQAPECSSEDLQKVMDTGAQFVKDVLNM